MLHRYSKDKNGKLVQLAVVYEKKEHGICRESIDSDALRVVEHLRGCGFESYIVGGAVRDLLVEKIPKDFDIVTSATPSKIKRLFKNSRIIGKRFRLVHVFFGEKIFEVSTFRSVIAGSVGNDFGTIDEDVQRRDFSLNALYYDPIKEQVVDFVGGVQDVQKKIIRPVIPLERIFEEDPVRLLRAVKFSATLNFKMPHALKSKIRKSGHLLSTISPSRLTEELMKIINGSHSYEIVSAMMEYDIFMYLQPIACSMMAGSRQFERDYMAHLKGMDDFTREHKDSRFGKKLSFMLFDFVSSLTDWNRESKDQTSASELYTKTWTQCRNFVLPMNPPRAELEFAIKEVLFKLGINIKVEKRVANQ